MRIREEVLEGKDDGFGLSKDGILHRNIRLCIPDDEKLRNQVLFEAHKTPYSAYPRATKMYQDLNENLWLFRMKNDVAKYIKKCLTCQRVKVEHQRPPRELQPLEILGWKWEQITMDFVVGLPITMNNRDAI